MKKDLNDIIRASFEGQESKKAPKSIWTAINKELSENDVDSLVKNSFENQEEKAPEMVWERVQDQLDIDRVWFRIADKFFVRNSNYLIRIAAMFIAFIIPFTLDMNPLKNQDISMAATNLRVSTINSSSVSPTIPTEEIVSVVENSSFFTSKSPLEKVTSEVKKTIAKEIPKDDYNTDKTKSFHYGSLNPLAVGTVSCRDDLQFKPHFNHRPKRTIGLFVGGIGSLENTWILDNETRAGFDSESLVENKFTLGTSCGLFAEYQYAPNWSIAAEYLVQSRTNQRTNYYNNGDYSQKKREIDQHKFSLSLGWNSEPKFFWVSHSSVVKLGGYYSQVRNNQTYINGVITDYNNISKRSDIGLRFEVGKRIYLHSFIFDGGIRAHYGLMNLASEDSPIPTNLNYTRLVSGGFYLKAAYIF